MHQIGVKQAKEGRLISKAVLRKCRAKNRRLIPGILDQLEEDTSQKNQFVLYGHLMAYFASIYGHRLGVFQNLTIKEVEKAVKSDSTGSYLINMSISLHKTNQAFGPAQLSLTKEEYHWFRRFLALREDLVGGPEAVYFFFTSTSNPCKNLNNYFQGAWVSMGLPGKPTFTDIRTSIATHARNVHNPDNRQKVAKFMCHDTSNLSSRQAVEHRRLFEEALMGVEVSPSKPAEEEQQPTKRRAKSKHGAKAKRTKRAASPPDSPPSTSSSEEEPVTYQESGVSSLESPSSLEEYPTHLEPESSVAASSSKPSSPRPAESPEHAAQEPATSEPAASEPAASEPAASEPAASEPATSEPTASEPTAPEPAARPKRPVRTTRKKPMVVLSPLKVSLAKGSPKMVPCPFCPKDLSNMRQHLRITHGVANLRERQLWVRFSRRKVTQPLCPCPLCGGPLKHIRPHFANSHRDLSARKLRRTVRRFQWDITMERMRDLEASHPVVPMVTLFDTYHRKTLTKNKFLQPLRPPSRLRAPSRLHPPPPLHTPSHPIITPSSPGASAVMEEIAEGLKEFVQCMGESDVTGFALGSFTSLFLKRKRTMYIVFPRFISGSPVEQSEGGPLFGHPDSDPSHLPSEWSVDDFLRRSLPFALMQKSNVCCFYFITVSLDRHNASYAGAGVVQVFDEERAAQAPIMSGFLRMLEENSMDPLQWGEMDLGPRSPTLERI
nr:uncharacterized protein LOC129447508 [Misgurnus anguillicaudatus]